MMVNIVQEAQHELTTIPNTSWSTKWACLPFTTKHIEVLLTHITLEVKEEVGQHILEDKIIMTISQLLKLTPYLNTYLIVVNKQYAQSEGSTLQGYHHYHYNMLAIVDH